MFFPFLLLLGVISLGPQVALCIVKLSFSKAAQCEPAFVSFKGQLNSSVQAPLSLWILPFNSTPVSIPIPDAAMNSSGVNVTFLPVSSNTQFIASLNSNSGASASAVSDIFSVEATSPVNNSCLPQKPFTPTFQVDATNLSQCEDFTVRYKGDKPPSIQIFNPRSFSFPLAMKSNSNGTATYTMAALRQSQVVLMFTSGDGGQNETSSLLTVQGDAFSPTTCFPDFSGQNNKKGSTKPAGLSKGTIIGLSVGLGLTALLSIPMAWLVIRERRRRRRALTNRIAFDPSRLERAPSPYTTKAEENAPPPPPPFFGFPIYGEGYVRDPVYVSEKYSPTINDYPRTSISWEYLPRPDEPQSRPGIQRGDSSSINVLSSSNIEKMLNIAARGRASEDMLGMHSPRSVDSFVIPASPPAAVQHTPLGDRQQPDVPLNPSFFAEPSFILDPAVPLSESPQSMGSRLRPDYEPVLRSSFPSSAATEDAYVTQPPRAVIGLPTGPRSGSPRTNSRENSMVDSVNDAEIWEFQRPSPQSSSSSNRSRDRVRDSSESFGTIGTVIRRASRR